jgi:hypothetical protein
MSDSLQTVTDAMVEGIEQLPLFSCGLPELKKTYAVSQNVKVPLGSDVTKADGQQELPSELEFVPIQSQSGARDSRTQSDCHSSVGIGASVDKLVSIFLVTRPG